MKLFNGKELTITLASFQEANTLFKSICRAIKVNQIDIPDSVKKDLSALQLAGILDIILSVASDDEIETALFACAKRCAVGTNLEHIDVEYFEKAENRCEYLPIMIEVAKANLSPFMSGITSSLGVENIQSIIQSATPKRKYTRRTK
jgi:hypothetical protein